MENFTAPRMHTVTARQGTGSRGDRQMEVSFTDVQQIGCGTFGTVYKAQLCENNDYVAIKKVMVDERFKNRELHVMREIDHPNITRLHYFFESTEYHAHNIIHYNNMIMEFLPHNLHQIQKRYAIQNEIMPTFYVKLYSYQLLRGLGFLHMHKIVHRDIKPQNLLVDHDNGFLKICDFGSAKTLIEGEANISYICSRFYRAPEILYGSNYYGTSIDVWSAGTVIGEMMSLRPIFMADTALDVLANIMRAIGAPTEEELEKLNPKYVKSKIPRISARGLQSVINKKMSSDCLQLLNGLLKMDPGDRLHPIEALTLKFFVSLQDPDLTMPNGEPLPPLFNWFANEYHFRRNCVRMTHVNPDGVDIDNLNSENE